MIDGSSIQQILRMSGVVWLETRVSSILSYNIIISFTHLFNISHLINQMLFPM
jgi:hypothetical protein